MIATSIEQSKRLVGVGVNAEDTADFYYNSAGFLDWRGDPVLFMLGEFQTPAWSLSALWQMVYELDRTYEFPTELSADELMETLVCTIVYRKTH